MFVAPSLAETSPQSGDLALILQTELKQAKKSDVDVLYHGFDYKPLWIKERKPSEKALFLLSLIAKADSEGLNPNDYERATQAFTSLETASPQDIIKADIQFTEGVIVFIDHLRNGRFAPKSLNPGQKQARTNPVEVIAALLNLDGQNDVIDDLAPDFPSYDTLRMLLAQYKGLIEQYPKFPQLTTQLTLKKGSKSQDVLALRTILSAYGDLDSTRLPEDPSIFTEDLEVALMQFQTRHLLKATGVVDANTRKALNITLDERVKIIKINMERMRWYPALLGAEYITVNIPSYELRAHAGDEVKLTIPAIVGHPSRTTPLFYGDLVNIVFNPSWGVPVSIMLRDKIPQVLEDPYYLLEKGYKVTTLRGQPIDSLDIDWENVDATQYRLRKPPGPQNALGEMRFTLETPPSKGTNPFGIFLHGTPEKHLFNNVHRALSSGCIRLKDPRSLALWLLQDKFEWNENKLSAAIKTGRTQVVPLTASVPVYFTYLTVWIDDQGLVYFGDDPYRKDPDLMQKMGLTPVKKKKTKSQ